MSLAGERIKRCRLNHNLTQEDVARYLGIGKQAVYKYETGAVTNIPLENLEKMAVLFDTTPEYLAGWIDEKKYMMNLQLFSGNSLSSDEQLLLDTYRTLSVSGKQYLQTQLRIASTMFGEKSDSVDSHG